MGTPPHDGGVPQLGGPVAPPPVLLRARAGGSLSHSVEGRESLVSNVWPATVISMLTLSRIQSLLPHSPSALGLIQKSRAIGMSVDCILSHRSGGLSAWVSTEIFYGTGSGIKGAIH